GRPDPHAPATLDEVGLSLAPQHLDAHVVLAPRLLPAVAHEPRTIRVLVDYGEVVVNLAVFRAREDLAATHAHGFHRVHLSHGPGADVEVVHVLLDVEVARQPGEVVPVAHLVEHLGPAGLLRLRPSAAPIIVGEERQDFADCTVVDAPDGLAKAVV